MKRTTLIALAAALAALAALPPPTHAHGVCEHDLVHRYVTAPSPTGLPGRDVRMHSTAGIVSVWDTELEDCDEFDLLPGFDGDFDWGVGGAAFGHGAWMDDCDLHEELPYGAVTVDDFVWGQQAAYYLGSDDANGFLPGVPEFACVTDGLISPLLDGDDCLAGPFTGRHELVCPGGGDGLLWVILPPQGGLALGQYPATMGYVVP